MWKISDENYKMVDWAGLEPAASWLQIMRSTADLSALNSLYSTLAYIDFDQNAQMA